MASESAARQARRVLRVLRRVHGSRPQVGSRPALEHLLLGILANGVAERRAAAALAALSRAFVDWNEARVSSACEIAEAMGPMPRAMQKAAQIKAVLGRVFDRANEMSLDFLRERGQREALRLVSGIQGFPESALARATLLGLGQDSMPLTPGVLSVCIRLGLLRNGPDRKAMALRLGQCLPREAWYEFHWLVSRHAESVCVEEEPRCSRCRLRKDCRTGRARSSGVKRKASRT